MREVWVDLGLDRSYKVIIAAGILEETGRLLERSIGKRKVMIISNPLVFSLYGERVIHALQSAGMKVHTALIPDGEEYKNLRQVNRMLDEAVTAGLERSSLILALGGGVVGDLAGFTASIYQRGIRCIQVPTTLLSQVDSSVGGKTAVNHPRGKNMIGTFHQPSLVIIDTMTLTTLAEDEYRGGLGEVVKYGVIYDRALFQLLEEKALMLKEREQAAVQEIVYRCVKIKSEIVAEDERESGLRMVLNLGHTFGHSLEKLGNYKSIKHGEAVAIGTLIASLLSREMDLLDDCSVKRITALFKELGMAMSFPDYNAEDIYEGMLNDKKVQDEILRIVLPRGIGGYEIIDNPGRDLLLNIIENAAEL